MLIPSIESCKNACTSIKIYDLTGLYSSSNTGGWNTPNLSKNFTGTATIKIVTPEGSTLEYDVKEAIEDSLFPKYLLYEYIPEKLEDGIYTISLILVDTENNITYKADSILPIYCNVECCVNKLSASVAADLCNNCNSEATNKFDLAETLLTSLKRIAKCLGEKEFNKILSQLQKICNSTGCGC